MFIYKIVNKVNGKLYIGKTEKSLSARWSSHIKHCKNKVNRRLYDAMNKYGVENFYIELIEEADDVISLNKREIYWISFYQTTDKNFGYNMTDGGDGGRLSPELYKAIGRKVSIKNKGHIVSKATRKKISDAHVGMTLSQETKDKISQTNKAKGIKPPVTRMCGEEHPFFGKNHSSETKQKISLARKGKKYEEFMSLERSNTLKKERQISWSGSKNPNFKFFDFALLIKTIKENPTIDNKALARLLNSSTTTLHDKVKKEFGMTMTELKQRFSSTSN